MTTHILAFVGSLDKKKALEEAVQHLDDAVLTVQEGLVADAAERLANGSEADVIVVDHDPADEHAIKRLETIVAANPRSAVIATSPQASLESIRRLMRLGVADFVPQPLERDDLLAAIRSARPRGGSSDAANTSRGRVISLFKMTGGVGATTLAVQMAHAATVEERRLFRKVRKQLLKTTILDMDVQGGSIATYLDLAPKYTLQDVVSSTERLDPALLDSCLTAHDSGLRVLAAPTDLVPVDAIGSDEARQIVQMAREGNDLVVVDLPHAWTPWTSSVLKTSDLIVCVFQLTVASVRHTRRRIDALRQLGIDDGEVCLVANRYSSSQLLGSKRRVKDAEKALGRKVDYLIGSDFKSVNESLDIGKPLTEVQGGSRIAKDFAKFLDMAMERARQPVAHDAGADGDSSSIAA